MIQHISLALEFGNLGLPAGAAKLLDRELCQRRPKGSRPDTSNASSASTYLAAGSRFNASRKSGRDQRKHQEGLHGARPTGSRTSTTNASNASRYPAAGPTVSRPSTTNASNASSHTSAVPTGSRPHTNASSASRYPAAGPTDSRPNTTSASSASTYIAAGLKRFWPNSTNASNASLTQTQRKAILDGAPRSFTKTYLEKFDSHESTSLKATLDDAGFQKVVALNSTEEMKMYVRRVAHSCNLKVINDGGLNGAVTWFSNETQATGGFKKLKSAFFEALLAPSKDQWVIAKQEPGVSGDSAPLDLVGYVQVRALRNAEQMVTFVRRMIENMGVKIINEDGFNGMMHYYSDPYDSEGFEKLMLDIKKAANAHSWAELDD